ncbi:uncharacterized protein M421DRAFT_422020 [Didymella exigua CBS 183.55]|uniref:Heterokaryon incompatibility domain-containing protein n=1 Tax=Didymella exigua CBS 183.55 TaxID=1150837 RepID=A0A6A5RNQ9_9PLEO|nr:uncharacterized protein M421DRAFT_422020 [Didymella exigua CBS 183.55]KAF1927157.1 hypothetical protein M421DRAFT_422020 [Didymella exigua CBS 183.55]
MTRPRRQGQLVPIFQPDGRTSSFRYEPFSHPRNQIRLFRIRRHTSTRISFTVRNYNFGSDPYLDLNPDLPTYRALSYTWGEVTNFAPVPVNGSYHLQVSQNLHRFLEELCQDKHLDSGIRDHFLWIDQICINQKDLSEKTYQIPLMSKIYERAESVIVWLNDDSLLPVHSIGTTPRPKNLVRAAQDITIYARGHYFEFKVDQTRAPQHIVSAFRHLLQHNYFSRIWVVQELCLSTEAIILIEGGVWLDWRRMYDIWTECDFERGVLSPAVESMLRKGYGQDHLLHAIESYSGNHCYISQDKVYGLLGLVRKEERPVVDCKKTVEEVLAEVVEIALRVDDRDFYEFDEKVLFRLGLQMGLTPLQQNGWINYVRAVKIIDNEIQQAIDFKDRHKVLAKLRSLVGTESSRPSTTINAIGFTRGGATGTGKGTSSKIDFWAFQYKDVYYSFPCLPLSQLRQRPTSYHLKSENPRTTFTADDCEQLVSWPCDEPRNSGEYSLYTSSRPHHQVVSYSEQRRMKGRHQ